MDYAELWFKYRFPIAVAIGICIAAYNFAKRKYELITVNSDHLVISRLLMADRALYHDDITKLILKELPNGQPKLVIHSTMGILNFHDLDYETYPNVIEFIKKHDLLYYEENQRGVSEKVN